MLNGNEILNLNPDVVMQETGEELVVVFPDRGKYVVLNQTGAKILQMSDGKRTLAEIAAAISASFDTDLVQVTQDVFEFSKDLISRGILSIVEADI